MHGDNNLLDLKEYYEIVGESRPLSAFFPTRADFFTEMHFTLLTLSRRRIKFILKSQNIGEGGDDQQVINFTWHYE